MNVDLGCHQCFKSPNGLRFSFTLSDRGLGYHHNGATEVRLLD